MSMRINTNVQAINALRNLGNTTQTMGSTIERLASGLRVNRASDDPAGLIISENLRSYIASLQQAMSNAQDATNMIKTAEAALDEVHTALRTMRQLTIHAANTGVNDQTALQADQTQIRALVDSINRIAEQTAFGNKKLFDGTSGISAQVTNTNYLSGAFVGGTFAGLATSSGYVDMSVVQRATRATFTGTQLYAGLTAQVSVSGAIVVNGQTINLSTSDTVQGMLDKINGLSNVTGVTAVFSSTAGTSGMVKLVHRDFGSQNKIVFHDIAGIIAGAGSSTNQAGIDAVVNVEANTASGITAVLMTGGRSMGDSGLRLTDAHGNVFMMTEAGNAANGTLDNVALISAGQLQFQVGPSGGQSVRFSLFDLHSTQLGTTIAAGKSLATIDVTQQNSTNEALEVIDAAIQQISRLRGDMGSFQRYVLESNIRSLNVAKENVTASESTIRDADFASEITTYTKQQILMQSGMSVLAQANQLPQQVLSLLR